MTGQIEVEFWSRVIKEPNSGCWLWTGATLGNGPRGYGYLGAGESRVLAHRLSWSLHNGPIPEGMLMCHRCDQPSCVNPAHLFLGTQSDNMGDAARKGRYARGAKHHRTHLTESDVLSIRQSPDPHRVIAERFGVSRRTVNSIKNGRTWAWLVKEA